jgi:hypothetical protein
VKPADTRISPGTEVRFSNCDAGDNDIIGKEKSDTQERLDANRTRFETL